MPEEYSSEQHGRPEEHECERNRHVAPAARTPEQNESDRQENGRRDVHAADTGEFVKVLIVEDDLRAQQTIWEYLECDEARKFIPSIAGSVREAKDILQRMPYGIELILLDVCLPGEGGQRADIEHGLEFCRLVRTHADYKHIPVIAISGVDRKNLDLDLEVSRVKGPVLLPKPFTEEKLRCKIASVLDAFGCTPVTHRGESDDDMFPGRIRHCIMRNIHDRNLNAEKLAVMLRMNKKTLGEKLKKIQEERLGNERGWSVGRYINWLRVNYAAFLICQGYTCDKAAELCGMERQTLDRNMRDFLKFTPAALLNDWDLWKPEEPENT